MTITGYSKCICGAITLIVNGTPYSVRQSHLKRFFPQIDLRTITRYPETFCCDHCVNHYGLDLCGCGSGVPFGHCDNGLAECRKPMQSLGEYAFVRARDSLI
jgi:hypothetical protein